MNGFVALLTVAFFVVSHAGESRFVAYDGCDGAATCNKETDPNHCFWDTLPLQGTQFKCAPWETLDRKMACEVNTDDWTVTPPEYEGWMPGLARKTINSILRPGNQVSTREGCSENNLLTIGPWVTVEPALPWTASTQVHGTILPHVVVITPTYYGRRQFDKHIYSGFMYQDYPPEKLDLLVVEQTGEPEGVTASAFKQAPITDNPRVHLHEYEMEDTKAFLGQKHNLVWDFVREKKATGDARWSGEVIIVSFDDDDFYSPQYVSKVVNEFLADPSLKVVKIANYHGIEIQAGASSSYVNTAEDKFKTMANYDIAYYTTLLSWGFVYSYRYSVNARFGQWSNNGEDMMFMARALSYGEKIKAVIDSGEAKEATVVKRADMTAKKGKNFGGLPCTETEENEKLQSALRESGYCVDTTPNDYIEAYTAPCETSHPTGMTPTCAEYYRAEFQKFINKKPSQTSVGDATSVYDRMGDLKDHLEASLRASPDLASHEYYTRVLHLMGILFAAIGMFYYFMANETKGVLEERFLVGEEQEL